MPLHRELKRNGFSFVELMIVLTIVGISVALIVPSMSASAPDQLAAASRSLAADMDYVRDLAMRNNTSYRFSFDTSNNVYFVTHAGSNSAFDVLPDPPIGSAVETSRDGKQWSFDLNNLPQIRMAIRLEAVLTTDGTNTAIAQLEFGPLGQTSNSAGTAVWLTAGNSSNRNYQPVAVNPVTGMARIQEIESISPLNSRRSTNLEHVAENLDEADGLTIDDGLSLPTADGGDSSGDGVGSSPDASEPTESDDTNSTDYSEPSEDETSAAP